MLQHEGAQPAQEAMLPGALSPANGLAAGAIVSGWHTLSPTLCHIYRVP